MTTQACAGSSCHTRSRLHRKVLRDGDGPSSRRGVFVAVRRSPFLACGQANAICVGIGGDRVGLFRFLFSHLVAGFFGNLFPMFTHLAALPCETSREPLSPRECSRPRRSAICSITRSGGFALSSHRVGPCWARHASVSSSWARGGNPRRTSERDRCAVDVSVAMQGNSDLMDEVEKVLCPPLAPAHATPAPPQGQSVSRDVFDGRPQLPSPRGPISHAVIKALSHPIGVLQSSARPHRRGTHRRGLPAGALLLLRAALSRVRRRRRRLGMESRSPTAPQRAGAGVRRESSPGAPG